MAGSNDQEAKEVYEFGKNIGIAFQLQDDILDVYGDTEKFGKQQGGDIVANKKTFLLLKAIEMAEGNMYKKEELQHWIHAPEYNAKDKVEAIMGVYNFFDIKRLAQEEMEKYYTLAITNLEHIASISENKKAVLKEVADGLMVRES